MINVLIKDKIDSFVIEELKKRAFTVHENTEKPEMIFQEVQDNEILIVRSATKINKKVLDCAAQTGMLKLIIRAGVGLDNIDVNYAQSKGIMVANTPEASSSAVAELALAHMFALARKMIPANLSMREKKWNKKQCQGIELSGKTLGIIGMGRIGQALAQKAAALGMEIIYADIMGPMDVNSDWKCVSTDELICRSDFISLHIPTSQKGNYFIDEPELKKMKKDAFLINTARGRLINEKVLIEALDKGEIAGAGIDVYCQEPCDNTALLQHKKVSVTPHIGASTCEAQFRIGQQILRLIEEYRDNKLFREENKW
ncbi:MAG: NAD(P)-dependent oxidoreductase [Atribacterota bacterium]